MAAASGETARRLSGLERTWLIADRMGTPFVIALVLDGEGEVKTGQWAEALAAAARVNPGCRVRLRGHLGWSRWVVVDAAPPVQVASEVPWDRPLSPRVGPICELILLPARGQVCLRVLHGAMDGRGLLHLAEDLLRCVNGLAPIGAEAGPTTDMDLAATLAAPRPTKAPRHYAAPTGPAREAPVVARRHRVRLQGCYHDLLPRALIALWRASRAFTEGPLRIDLPVDMRRHAPDLRSTANLSGITATDLEYEPSIEDLRARTREALDANLEAGVPAGASALRWFPLWLATGIAMAGAREGERTHRFEISATVSNLGRLDLDALSGPVFRVTRAAVMPPANPGLPLLIVLTGDDEGVEICGASMATWADEGRLEGLLEGMARVIRESEG